MKYKTITNNIQHDQMSNLQSKETLMYLCTYRLIRHFSFKSSCCLTGPNSMPQQQQQQRSQNKFCMYQSQYNKLKPQIQTDRCCLEPKRFLRLSPQENPLKNPFWFQVESYLVPGRTLSPECFYMEPKIALPGTKKGSPVGIAKDPFGTLFCKCRDPCSQ